MKKCDKTKLGVLKLFDIKLGNFISNCKEKIQRNFYYYENIYHSLFCIVLILIICFNLKFVIQFVLQISTFAGVIVSLYLGLGKNKIRIGQNYEIRKGYAGVNLFGKNKSSCIIEITKISVVEIEKDKMNIVIPDYYFERYLNSEISKTKLVNSEGITRVPIIDYKNNLDILNPVLNERKQLKNIDENNEFIKWTQNTNGNHDYELKINFRRNDKYGETSALIPMKKMIKEDLIKIN
ncbi:hypothetical protein AKUA2003_00690 [Apilactobacillus kunkeei]|nr:hypothetical protein AKUA2003_00690 [Apilactobacillus kunkeei]CAI2552237.1 hypothetical protein AKUA1001_00690 [Apilactobacillus kunkeei]CAI2800990.1 hypothetical protein AKUA2002_00690 [Apilactobacillus kunkeei]